MRRCAETLRSPGQLRQDRSRSRFQSEQAGNGTKEENHGIADALILLEYRIFSFLLELLVSLLIQRLYLLSATFLADPHPWPTRQPLSDWAIRAWGFEMGVPYALFLHWESRHGELKASEGVDRSSTHTLHPTGIMISNTSTISALSQYSTRPPGIWMMLRLTRSTNSGFGMVPDLLLPTLDAHCSEF